MDEHDRRHGVLLQNVRAAWKAVFERSEQAVYLYLDDTNKVCNKRFASLLGYATPDEWASVKDSFPAAFVDEKSRDTLIDAFQSATENLTGSSIKVRWKKKSGGAVDTSVILIPFESDSHVFAMHFVEKLDD